MKILVRSPNWVGDQILAFPFFYFLKKKYPNAHVTAVCVPWVEDLQYRSLVDEVIILRKPIQNNVIEKIKKLNQMGDLLRSKGPYDLAFSLPNSLSAAFLLWKAQAQTRVGYNTDGRFLFLNKRKNWSKKAVTHRAQSFVNLLDDSIHNVQNFWGQLPENDLEDGIKGILEKFDFQKDWAPSSKDLIGPPKGPYYVIAPGATAESRRWMPESFARLARIIREETGMRGVIVGGTSEVGLGIDLSSDEDAGLLDWTARTSIPGLAHLISNAKFVVTNESGMAHVAAHFGAFVQIICGAANPVRTRPLGPGRVQVAVNPVECWPCERNHCSQIGLSFLQCLRGIEPETVWSEIKRGLALPNQIKVYT